MDKRERYDPEDIEILMQERSFDELLEEERAYVLRHLSDRAEYEAMRSLLMHMRQDAHDHEPLEADPAIRSNVLQAFRSEQRPQWRIWLNSVGAAFFPEEAKAMWRPAMALGGLALVVGIALFLARGSNSDPQQLAEVRPLEPQKETIQQLEHGEPIHQGTEEATLQDVSEGPATQAGANTSVLASPTEDVALLKSEAFLAEVAAEPMAKEIADDQKFSAVAEVSEEREELKSMADSEQIRPSHEVTAYELARNMSVANATGQVRAKQSRVDSDAVPMNRSTSMADNAGLLDLVAAGW